ncbi:MAG: class I SAM-dependent methyltransferase [Cyanobacteria bacterium Co-bin8]|nr:class I SAM-dependent methyltransferase [Cyanobacteria bacterium Co-bin8]
MAFTLDKVVPWGRSFAEYVAMFALSKTDLEQRILGCGDGPAAFNSELTQQGGRVTSTDPIYQFTAEEIRARIAATFAEVVEKTRQNWDDFNWTSIRSPEELGQVRMAAMEQFLADFDLGKAQRRYITASLPELPFADDSFDLALCSHFLFLYSPQFDAEFHLAAVQEMLRVAPEVRIFPLVELGNARSRHLDWVMAQLKALGHSLQVRTVAYEFQKGGNEMLCIYR